MDYLYDLACKLIDKTITFDDIDYTAKELNQLKGMTIDDISDQLAIRYYTNHAETGVLYCLWNPVYAHYGNNVYKLGCTGNLKKRLGQYTTVYVDPTEVKHESIKIHNHNIAEKILFHYLMDCRVAKNREFFRVDLQKVKDTIDKVAKEMTADFEGLLKANKWVLHTQHQVRIIYDFVKSIEKNTKDLIINKLSNKKKRIKGKLYKITKVKPITNVKPFTKQEILDADDISFETYNEYIKLENKSKLTNKMNIEIDKFKYKHYDLGVKDPDNEILAVYLDNKKYVDNFISLHNIGERKITDTIDPKIIQLKKNTINNLIQKIGIVIGQKTELTIVEFDTIAKEITIDKDMCNAFGIQLTVRNKERDKHSLVKAILETIGINVKKISPLKRNKDKVKRVADKHTFEYRTDVLNVLHLMNKNNKQIKFSPIISDSLKTFDSLFKKEATQPNFFKLKEQMKKAAEEAANMAAILDATSYC